MSELSGRVLALARNLREHGASVSADDVSTALASLSLLPLERRETVRAALAAALVKHPLRRPIFDRLFDIYFPARRSSGRRRGGGPGGEQELIEALQAGDSEQMRALAEARVEEYADVQPDASLSEESYIFRALRHLNLDAVLARLHEDARDGKGMTALQRKILEEDLTERMEQFREMLHDEVFSRLIEGRGYQDMARRQRRTPPEEVDFLWARESDIESVRTAIGPLARSLAVQLSRKRRRAHRGRLDMRRTLRRSLSTGGHFVQPAFKRPAAGKPELVLLCDVSGSMRAFAKFTLELTYALATQFLRVRAFVFVDGCDEVTHILESAADLSEALTRMDGEAKVVALDGQSWYGNAFDEFWQRAGRELTPRTTAIVVGDARNNFRTTGVEVMQRLREQVRRVYWLNPEPRSHWDAGDSVISRFAPYCDAVCEVRNVRQLAEFVARTL